MPVEKTILTAFAAVGGLLLGYEASSINGIIRSRAFINEIQGSNSSKLTDGNTALIISIFFCGALFGSIASGFGADWKGRRRAIICGSIIYSAAVIFQMMVGVWGLSARVTIVASRFFAGSGVGAVSTGVVVYMSETCSCKVRGACIGGFQWCIAIGYLVASIIVYAVDGYDDDSVYRILIGLQFLWPTILSVGVYFLPETPRYFARKGETMQSLRCLAQLRGLNEANRDLEGELSEIIIENHYTQSNEKSVRGWVGSHSGRFYGWNVDGGRIRSLMVGVMTQTLREWSGITFVFYYITPILESTGVVDDPLLIALILAIVNVCSTTLSLWTMDRFGRRQVLIAGASGLILCHFLIAIVGATVGLDNTHQEGAMRDSHWEADNRSAVNAQISMIAIMVFLFASTWGPASWVVVGEIFPSKTRSSYVGFSTATQWLWQLVITAVSPYVVGQNHRNGQSAAFFLWGGLCVAALTCTYLFIPEAKGLTLEQAGLMLRTETPRSSTTWRPKTLARAFEIAGPISVPRDNSPPVADSP
ncbi:hypothetical protein FALCPG4_015838 [Fusarium falciforme]